MNGSPIDQVIEIIYHIIIKLLSTHTKKLTDVPTKEDIKFKKCKNHSYGMYTCDVLIRSYFSLPVINRSKLSSINVFSEIFLQELFSSSYFILLKDQYHLNCIIDKNSFKLYFHIYNLPNTNISLFSLPNNKKTKLNSYLTVLYEDPYIVIINKFHNVLSVPGNNKKLKDISTLLKEMYETSIWTVHRLDYSTSGIMIFAKTKETCQILNNDFQLKKINKLYTAACIGNIYLKEKLMEGEINKPICPDKEKKLVQKVDKVHGKKSITKWKIIYYNNKQNITLIELRPISGKSHQLRVHMKDLGFPIVGDDLYGNDSNIIINNNYENRLYLHAQELTLSHPIYNNIITFKFPCPFTSIFL